MSQSTLHNQWFLQGENGHNAALVSNNGRFHATMQADGNFVLYNGGHYQAHNAFWSTNTHGKGQHPYKLRMQGDGNLVIYDHNNHPTWASNTAGKGSAPFRLVMQDDRNLVIYDAHNTATWASNTWQG